MDTTDLEIRSEEIDGKDIIDRYTAINPKISSEELREKFQEHRKQKNPRGFPVVLIFEDIGISVEYPNPKIPSEVELQNPLDKKPSVILVPQKLREGVLEKLQINNIEAKVLPIEILELD